MVTFQTLALSVFGAYSLGMLISFLLLWRGFQINTGDHRR